MTEAQRKRRKSIVVKAIYIPIILLAVIFVFVTIGANHQYVRFFQNEENISYLSSGWIVDDGEKQLQIELPSKKNLGITSNTVTLSNTLPEVNADDVIMFRTSLQKLIVYIDGVERYTYGHVDSRMLGQIRGSIWNFIPLNEVDSGKEIRMIIESPYKEYRNTFNMFSIGSYSELYSYLMDNYIVSMWMAELLLFLGVAMLMVAGIAHLFHLTAHTQALWVGSFSVLVAVWVFSECKLTQFVIGNMAGFATSCYIVVALMIIPFLLYFDEVQQFYYHKYYAIMVQICIINMFVQLSLHLLGIFDLHEMMFVSHIIIGLSVVLLVFSSMNYFRRVLRKVHIPFVISIFVTMIFSFGELINVYSTGASNGTLIGIGVLSLAVFCTARTIYNLIKAVIDGRKAVKESEAKTMFLANMSHEIRTPMNAICALSELLIDSPDMAESDRENSKIINRSALNLLDIVNDILDYSRITENKLELVRTEYKLNELIADCVKTIKTVAALKNIDVNVYVGRNVFVNLVGDPGKLRQLLINILNNGVKYTKEGSVTMNVDMEVTEEAMCRFIFEVVDTGIGISQDKLETIFDAYSQVDVKRERTEESTGLGLAISKGISEAMGGGITVESEVDKGSRFTVTVIQETYSNRTYYDELNITGGDISYKDDRLVFVLPYKMRDDEPEKKYVDASKAKIMVVDDNVTNLKVMREMLAKFNAKATLISSGTQAIAAFKTKKYDIIYMDHMMPGLDGIETTAEIRKMTEFGGDKVKIIALTAIVGKGVADMFSQNGFDSYISKPTSVRVLEKTLIDMLGEEIIEEN